MAREDGREAVEIYSELEILTRVDELSREVYDYYGPIDNLLVLGVLTGSFVFMADFTRALGAAGLPHQVAFMGVESQNAEVNDGGQPRITLDLRRPIDQTEVLLLDELRDTGNTFQTLLRILSAKGSKSLEVLSLFYKDGAEEVDIPIRFKGLSIPNVYVEGYGLDDAKENGRWRKNLIYWR